MVACSEPSTPNSSSSSPSPAPPPPPALSGPCTLPTGLVYSPLPYAPYATDSMLCPVPLLSSFLSYTAGFDPELLALVTLPFPPPPTPGAVTAGGNFTLYFNCTCIRPDEYLAFPQPGSGGAAVCVAGGGGGGGGGDGGRTGLIVGIVVVAVVPWLLVSAGVYICVV